MQASRGLRSSVSDPKGLEYEQVQSAGDEWLSLLVREFFRTTLQVVPWRICRKNQDQFQGNLHYDRRLWDHIPIRPLGDLETESLQSTIVDQNHHVSEGVHLR